MDFRFSLSFDADVKGKKICTHGIGQVLTLSQNHTGYKTILETQWLRVSLESNPELISTPAVEFGILVSNMEFRCRIWNLGVEFSI